MNYILTVWSISKFNYKTFGSIKAFKHLKQHESNINKYFLWAKKVEIALLAWPFQQGFVRSYSCDPLFTNNASSSTWGIRNHNKIITRSRARLNSSISLSKDLEEFLRHVNELKLWKLFEKLSQCEAFGMCLTSERKRKS